jgi:hypothetical protein
MMVCGGAKLEELTLVNQVDCSRICCGINCLASGRLVPSFYFIFALYSRIRVAQKLNRNWRYDKTIRRAFYVIILLFKSISQEVC